MEKNVAKSYIESLNKITLDRFSPAHLDPRDVSGTNATLVEQTRILVKLFLEIPVRRMTRLAEERKIRFIFLLIPPRDPCPRYVCLADVLKSLFQQRGIEYWISNLWRPTLKLMHRRNLNRGILQRIRKWSLPDLDNICLHYHFEHLQRSVNYIDFYHLTKKGNQIVADRIFEYLTSHPTAPSRT